MKKNTILKNDIKYISNATYEKIKNYTISKDDLYLTIAGTIGKVGTVPDYFDDMNLTENAVKLCNIKYIQRELLMYFISSKFVQSQFCDKTTQVAQPKLAIKRIETTLIPIPPLIEELKIEKEINNLLIKIETIIEHYNNIIKLKDSLKNKILDLAIKGKLVKQNFTDESAEVLINKILNEKKLLIKSKQIKKENLSVIYKDTTDNQFYEKFDDGKIVNITDEIPFDIPESWCWTRLKNICLINPKNSLDDELDTSFIPMSLIDSGYSNSHTFEIKKWKEIKNGFTSSYEENSLTYLKNSTSAMYAPEFLDNIKALINLKEIVIAGVCTDICDLNLALPLINYFDENNQNVETYDALSHPKDEYNEIALKLMRQAGIKVIPKYERGER